MIRHAAGALAALLAAATPAAAEETVQRIDCSAPTSRAEETICADPALVALDRELSRLYRLAAEGAERAGEPAARLRAAQRDWLEKRDACPASSLGPETCLTRAYAGRIAEIRAGHANARSGGEGASIGPYAYRCEGLDAPLSATFLTTEEALVHLAWGETALVLERARAASGARYESDGDAEARASFWTKGDTALFLPPGGQETTCAQEPIG